MKLVLIGMMGTGKSTVGRLVAGALHRPFIDTDSIVEIRSEKLIRQIFEQEGEAGFRRREADAVLEAMKFENAVIATGGGAVLNPVNRAALMQDSLVVWLDAEPEELLRRTSRRGVAARPLLGGPDPLQTLHRLREERAALYSQTAHLRIDCGGQAPEAIAAQVRSELLSREGTA